MKQNLLDLSYENLKSFLSDAIGIEEKKLNMRTQQIFTAVYQKGLNDFSQLTTIPIELREVLEKNISCNDSKIVETHESTDGTLKFLFNVGANQVIESVFIPEDRRNTLCLSSQVGCAMDCSFCATGRQGFSRNLTSDEIIGQLMAVINEISLDQSITNVVFMGMGEPLTNMNSVVKAIEDAKNLASLLKYKPAKVNLIPFNDFTDSTYTCSSRDKIERFCKHLQSKGIFASIRKTRGSDINAACGQLAGKVNDKIKKPLSKRLQ